MRAAEIDVDKVLEELENLEDWEKQERELELVEDSDNGPKDTDPPAGEGLPRSRRLTQSDRRRGASANLTAVREQFARWDGTTENPRGSNYILFNDWYFGRRTKAAWCATFFSYAMYHAGMPIPATTSKGFAWTPSGAKYFKDRGLWVPRNGTIEPGFAVFYYWPNLGRIGHVGWVDAVYPNGTFHAWEGNTDAGGGRTGGRVIRQLRSRATVGAQGGFGKISYAGAPLPPPPPPPPPDDRQRPYPGLKGGYSRERFQGRYDGNVEWIQRRLNGTNLQPKLRQDGDFGPATDRAVRGFQGAMRLEVDGVVGPVTWNKLKGW